MPRTAPPPRRSPLLPFYIVLGVAALVAAVLVFRQLSSGGGTAATTLDTVVMTPEQLNRVPGIPQGSPDAPVVVMEFGDFQCQGCASFARFAKPLLADHIRDGTVRFVWYDFPLVQIHDNAVLAARAGRCAHEQGRFWEYHDVLFGTQAEWSAARGSGAVDRFVDYAERAGLDRAAFSACLRSDRFQQEVSQSHQFGQSLNVGGTPTVFVNGKRLDRIPGTRAEWDALVRQELGSDAPEAAAAGA